MKKTIFLFIFQLLVVLGFAQTELLVQKSDKGLYLSHVVAPKESFYSIGRAYGVNPKELAEFNQLDMTKGLNIGQAIHIPLNAGNFTQSGEGKTPVYYMVQPSEGLYRVSVKNNNVLMADLRKWNHLSNDHITSGQKLIVGYLRAEAPPVVAAAPQQPVESKPASTQAPEPVKQAPRQEPVITRTEPQQPPAQAQPQPEPVRSTTASTTAGGFFHPHFDQQQKRGGMKKEETASAGIFKTESGWTDQKYYVLMDKVEPGTIVKITNPSNQKTVYAKVLGEMSGIRQNMGYDVRLSSAAASALEVSDTDKFIVKLNY